MFGLTVFAMQTKVGDFCLAESSLCVCVSVGTPFFPTRLSDGFQIWHAYVDRSGNCSQLK